MADKKSTKVETTVAKPRESKIERLQRELREEQEREQVKLRVQLTKLQEQLKKVEAQSDKLTLKKLELAEQITAVELAMGMPEESLFDDEDEQEQLPLDFETAAV